MGSLVVKRLSPSLWTPARATGPNFTAYGFVTSFSGTTGSSQYDNAEITKWVTAGADHARIPVRPDYLYSVLGTPATLATRLGYVFTEVDRFLANGYTSVVLNNHIALGLGSSWEAADICSAFDPTLVAHGQKWLDHIALIEAYALLLIPYGARVAFAKFNERPGTQTNLNAMVQAEVNAFRAINPSTTLLLTSDNTGSYEGWPNLNTEAMTGLGNWRFHAFAYWNRALTHAGVATVPDLETYSNVYYPLMPSQRASLEATANANGDAAIDWLFSQAANFLSDRIADATAWKAARPNAPSMYISEFAINLDAAAGGCGKLSAQYWMREIVEAMTACTAICGWAYWAVDSDPWHLKSGGVLDKDYLQPLGLTDDRANHAKTTTLLNYYSGNGVAAPSQATINAINEFFRGLDTAGISGGAAWIPLLCETSGAMHVNFMTPASFTLTPTNTPRYTANHDFRSSVGVDAFFATGITISTSAAALGLSQNDCSIWEYKWSDANDTGRDAGTSDSTPTLHFGIKSKDGVGQAFLASSTESGVVWDITDASVTRSPGFFGATRKANNLITFYNLAKGKIGTVAQISETLVADDYYVLTGSGTSEGVIGAQLLMPGLTETQSYDLRVIISNVAQMVT